MPKRAYSTKSRTRAKAVKAIQEPGRGAGYEPFLSIHDFSSRGRSSRMTGNVPGRIHHMMSDNERAVFLALLYADGIIEIREQFRLELDTTIRIAAEAGIAHPRPSGSDFPAVMTTDFLVTLKTHDGTTDSAIAVKPADELDNARVIEKLEIERRYWREKNIPWQICTEREMALERKNFLLWLHGRENFLHMNEPYDGYWASQCNNLIKLICDNGRESLRCIFDKIDAMDGACRGHGVAVLRQMLAAKRIVLKERQFIDLNGAANQLILTTNGTIGSARLDGG